MRNLAIELMVLIVV